MEDKAFFQLNGNKKIKIKIFTNERNARESNGTFIMVIAAGRTGSVYAIHMISDPEITYPQIVKSGQHMPFYPPRERAHADPS